ncbi:hypothetical protein TRVA0_016S00298 [Trichomonascus vanleenenianus]|uniref:Pumilio-family RNA binding repeat-containing protein n=1 Tax=Trichomonascus vanleenenianus TaxID=2268995 RepID=UPI003ECACBC3
MYLASLISKQSAEIESLKLELEKANNRLAIAQKLEQPSPRRAPRQFVDNSLQIPLNNSNSSLQSISTQSYSADNFSDINLGACTVTEPTSTSTVNSWSNSLQQMCPQQPSCSKSDDMACFDFLGQTGPMNTRRNGDHNPWIYMDSALSNSAFVPEPCKTVEPPVTLANSIARRPHPAPTNSTVTPLATSGDPSSKSVEVYYPIKNYNEPLNYRKLLERTVSCNWRLIVNRIVLDNDQQASIFLQQKLKVASPEQKNGIIGAIISQCYLLMINRFGNFLVQRCLEYGTPEQIAQLTERMIGNVVELAMDPFGCHVIQKALDCVNAEMRERVIEEMLSSVNETIIHRYACHVWQKLFELRWHSTPPRFMQNVNHALKGMWTQVALGETGSLVVQNIFENCTDEHKRQCIEEMVANLDTIICGQWGNWVVQHMVEHASEPYRTQVISAIIESAQIYSVDQFASKAVEKMLKMGDAEIVQQFLVRVMRKDPDRPRIPLIDIASDAHGNYLVQYILQNGTPAQKDEVAHQIRKHMVSLRGSKWGSKCAWLIDKNQKSKALKELPSSK